MPEHAQQVKGKIGLVPDETLLFDQLTGLEFTGFVGRMCELLHCLDWMANPAS